MQSEGDEHDAIGLPEPADDEAARQLRHALRNGDVIGDCQDGSGL